MNLKELMKGKNSNVEPIFDMARVGFFENDKLELYVRTDDEGNEPHFHIRDKTTKGQVLNTCVKIGDNRYFHHGKYQGELNSGQRKSLMCFLCSKPKNASENTNYEYIVALWNDNNNSKMNVKVEKDENGNVIIPDYTYIKPYKEK